MRTFAAMLVLVVVASAGAQPAPQTLPPDAPVIPAAPPSAPQSAGGPFRLIDAAIKELAAESGQRFDDCLKAAEYLRADLTATQRRLKARNGGKIPSEQAGLVAAKTKRAGRQEQECIALAKSVGGHFDIAMHSLAGIEPPSHPGIPARRAKIVALREKFNATLKRLKTAGVPVKEDEGETGGAQDSAQ